MPPSTRNVDAVTNEASSLARNATAAAISSGSANRPIGMCTRRRAARSGSLGEQLLEHRRAHRPRAQRVDPDALAGELHAELAAHRQHAALGRGVGDLRRRRAHHGDERRDVDDRARALALHVRDDVLAAQVHRRRFTSCTRCHISVDVVRIESSSGGEMPALWNDDVDRAVRVERGGERGLHVGFRRDVGARRTDRRPAAAAACPAGLVDVDGHDVARPRRRDGGRSPARSRSRHR